MVKVEPLPSSLSATDVAAEHPAEVPGDGEPEPGAAIVPGGRGVGLAEGLEERRQSAPASCRCRCRTTSNSTRSPPLGQPSCRQRDPALLGELGGVAEQVEQDLAELGLVRAASRRGRAVPRARSCCRSWPPAARPWHCTSASRPATSNASRNTSILPASIFDRSRMSLIRPSRCLPAPRIFSRSGLSSGRPAPRPPRAASRCSR